MQCPSALGNPVTNLLSMVLASRASHPVTFLSKDPGTMHKTGFREILSLHFVTRRDGGIAETESPKPPEG